MTMVAESTALAGVVIDSAAEFTLGDLCCACSVHADWLIELVDEGILEPLGPDPAHWRFVGASLHRAQIVQRLQSDLGVNLAGAALALDLLNQIDDLRRRLALLERRD